MSDLTAPGVKATEEGGLMGSLRRVVRVVYSPTKVFEELDRRPDWLVPLIICILVAAISSWVLIPNVILPAQREALESRGLTEDQLDAARPWLEGSRPLYIGLASAVVVGALSFIIVAGVFHLIFTLLLGGQANFGRTFAVVVYSFVIGVLASMLKVPIELITKRTEGLTSLGLLLGKPDVSSGFAHRFAYKFMDQFDVFNLWILVLLGIGFSIIFKFSRQKSYVVVCGLWLLFVLAVSLLGAIVPGRAG